jgi:hypothetical protein
MILNNIIMSDKIYCGVEEPSGHKRRGTAKECLKKNQVRYWGIRKIDSHTLKKMKEYKKSIQEENRAGIKMTTLDMEIRKIKAKLSNEDLSDRKRDQLKRSLDKKIESFKQYRELYKKLKKKNQHTNI